MGGMEVIATEENNAFHSGKIQQGELETNGFISSSHDAHGDAAYELSVNGSPH